LSEESNVQNLHIASSDKPVACYNLDVITSVSYRVNSHRGTQFRICKGSEGSRIGIGSNLLLTISIASEPDQSNQKLRHSRN